MINYANKHLALNSPPTNSNISISLPRYNIKEYPIEKVSIKTFIPSTFRMYDLKVDNDIKNPIEYKKEHVVNKFDKLSGIKMYRPKVDNTLKVSQEELYLEHLRAENGEPTMLQATVLANENHTSPVEEFMKLERQQRYNNLPIPTATDIDNKEKAVRKIQKAYLKSKPIIPPVIISPAISPSAKLHLPPVTPLEDDSPKVRVVKKTILKKKPKVEESKVEETKVEEEEELKTKPLDEYSQLFLSNIDNANVKSIDKFMRTHHNKFYDYARVNPKNFEFENGTRSFLKDNLLKDQKIALIEEVFGFYTKKHLSKLVKEQVSIIDAKKTPKPKTPQEFHEEVRKKFNQVHNKKKSR